MVDSVGKIKFNSGKLAEPGVGSTADVGGQECLPTKIVTAFIPFHAGPTYTGQQSDGGPGKRRGRCFLEEP